MKLKIYFSALLTMTLCFLSHVGNGQSLDSANVLYSNFITLCNNTGATKDATYDALQDTYAMLCEVIKVVPPKGADYTQAKQKIRNLHNHFRTAAIYYSQTGNPTKALGFAQAYVDIPLMEQFKDDHFAKDNYYPTLVYFAASGTYNSQDYKRSIVYFREYLNTSDLKARHNVFLYMAKACTITGDLRLAMIVLDEAIHNYPTDYNLLSMAINCCIDIQDNTRLQKYVTKALVLKPDDATLVNIQGKLYEETFDFKNALKIYQSLKASDPQNIDISKHLAINYFNLGVTYNNRGLTEGDATLTESIFGESQDYFRASSTVMEEILATDPTSLKYMQALATAYSCVNEFDKVQDLNNKIVALGGGKVTKSDIPSLIAFNESNAKATAMPTLDYNNMPVFSTYAKEYVEHTLTQWQTKDPFETVEEYQKRVNNKVRDDKIRELLKDAQDKYIATYTEGARFDNLTLKPYDAENRAFLAESEFGEIIIPVPRENNEAKVFESGWLGTRLQNPEFYINNNKILLASIEVITPEGKTYYFDTDKDVGYTETNIDINFEAIDRDVLAMNKSQGEQVQSKVRKNTVMVGASDVDMNIPTLDVVNNKTFAVIISNENYQTVTKVPLALNDGRAFSLYCEKTLGLPKTNIRTYDDATYGTMLRAVRDIKDISSAYKGDIEVLFYYAGHGIPDERSKGAFLLPVDADGQQTEGCYSLDKLYTNLGSMNAKGVYVFLDACFSGAKRDGGTISTESRGIAIKSKVSDPKGNMVIFSAASDDQTALPLTDKGHGLFTYYLLKKLQETKGDVTLKELSDYLVSTVQSQSIIVNRKKQTPSTTTSLSLQNTWSDIKLIPEIVLAPTAENEE